MLILLGVFIGFVLAMYGQWLLEQGYERDKIAKINRKFYRIIPLEQGGHEEHDM